MEPYTEKQLDTYIEETYSFVNEHPKCLMHLVAKWIDDKNKTFYEKIFQAGFSHGYVSGSTYEETTDVEIKKHFSETLKHK